MWHITLNLACNRSNCGACATSCPNGQQCTQDDCCIESCQRKFTFLLEQN